MSDINVTVQDEIVNIDILDTPVLVNVVNSPGVPGAPGQGVPVGGTTGQVLAKSSNANYATAWVNVSGGAWGTITGTLSNQTDLQNALNGKFDDPTGTTAQYLRGDGSLATFPAIPSGTVTSVGLTMPSAFSVANSPITSSGTLAVTATGDTTQYIAGDGSLLAFPITGQAGTLVREVRNVTGATLTKGTVVYINGASGNKPTVAKALATSDATSAQTFGLIQADIPNNSNGYLVAFGDLDGLNTSAFAEGVQLYLSSTTAGGYTSTKQYAPNHLVYIGVVTRQHVNQGRIEVRIQNGYELDELHDVAAQTPSNNDGLFYNSTNSLWENKSIATALGYTPANAATTLTINGVSYDLSANRTWTVSGGISGSGAAGQVSYWDGTTSQAGSSTFLFTPTSVLDISNSVTAASAIARGTRIRPSLTASANNDVLVGLDIEPTFTNGAFTGVNNYGVRSKGVVLVQLPTSGANEGFSLQYVADNTLGGTFTSKFVSLAPGVAYRDLFFSSRAVLFQQQGYINSLFISSAGNTVLGSTTDSGQRLQVQGTTLLNGNVTFSSSTGMFWDATNSRLGIGTNAPDYSLTISKNLSTPDGLNVSNTNSSSYCDIAVGSNGGVNVRGLHLYAFGSTYSGVGAFSPSNVAISTGSAVSRLAFVSFGSTAWYNGTSAASGEVMQLTSTGRLLIGSTTDSGERLQVTGTMKVTGEMTVTGADIKLGTANRKIYYDASNDITITSAYGWRIRSWNYSIIDGSSAGNGGLLVSVGNAGTKDASAVLQVDSTTKGFLPPRMTTTQKNAISSPAAGLVVYDTTLAKLCVYTTAWETITSI